MNAWDKLKVSLGNYWEILILNIPKIAISIIIFMTFVLISIGLGRFFKTKMRRKATDSITANFVVRISKFIIIVFGIMLAFHALGFTGIAGGLLAGAGASAVIIGFAFKEIGENFLSGIILIFDRPFNIGNTVTIGENTGIVTGLGFRTTHLKAFDGEDIYVPNSSVIRNRVINLTKDGLLRHEFKIPIDKKEDISKIKDLVFDTLKKHPKVFHKEQIQVLIDEIQKDQVILKILFWIETEDYKYASLQMKSEVMYDVSKKIAESKSV